MPASSLCNFALGGAFAPKSLLLGRWHLEARNFALGGVFAPKSLLLGRWHLEARRKIALIGSKPLLVLICHSSRCRDGASIPW